MYKLHDYYPNYTAPFDGSTIKTINVYAGDREKVGSVKDILVDLTPDLV